MRKLLVVPIVALLFAASTSVALASGLHFKSGPVFSVSNGTVTASGQVAGAGTSIDATLVVKGTVTGCTNKGGFSPAPKDVSFSSTTTAGPINTFHGNATFSVQSAAPSVPAGTCPNGNWTLVITGTATLTITSSNGGTLGPITFNF